MQVSDLGLRSPTESEQEAYIDAQGTVIGLAPYLHLSQARCGSLWLKTCRRHILTRGGVL